MICYYYIIWITSRQVWCGKSEGWQSRPPIQAQLWADMDECWDALLELGCELHCAIGLVEVPKPAL